MDDENLFGDELDRYVSYIIDELYRRRDGREQARRLLISMGKDPDQLEREAYEATADFVAEVKVKRGFGPELAYEHPHAAAVSRITFSWFRHPDPDVRELYLSLRQILRALTPQEEQLLLDHDHSPQDVASLKAYLASVLDVPDPE